MRYLYYPGCSLHTTGRAYEESMHAVFSALGVPLEEIDDWNCCGATAYMAIDETKAFALAARNLALAEVQGNSNGAPVHVIAPCSACYLVLSKTQHYVQEYPQVRDEIIPALEDAGLTYTGKVVVRHPLDVIVNDIGLGKVTSLVRRSLKGMKVASYYGCQMVRPFKTFDHQIYPTTMDSLVKALGAEPVDWPLKTRCCGGTLTGTIPEAGLRLNRALIKAARKRGAELMLTSCPLCQFNLEAYQNKISALFDEDIHLPISYFTQLMGVAFGLADSDLGMHRLFHRPQFPTVVRKGEAAHV